MSDHYLMVGDLARWEVMWVVKKPGEKKPRIVCVEFENDLPAAMELYVKVKTAGKKLATLRCCNVGFPPPERLRPRYEERVLSVERVKVKGKYYKKVRREEVEVIPMDTLNKRGVWWCPYCRELRKFEHFDGFHTDQVNVLRLKKPGYVSSPGFRCPMCWISQNDNHVRRWNPQAAMLEFRYKQRSRHGRRRTRR